METGSHIEVGEKIASILNRHAKPIPRPVIALTQSDGYVKTMTHHKKEEVESITGTAVS